MILAFHGCPGLPSDFAALTEALKQTPQAPSIKAVVRAGYPGAKPQLKDPGAGVHYLGYSFGCADCVESAAKDPSAKSVLLVAPHLFPAKEASTGMKALLAVPLLSDALLLALGPKAMKELIVKTAFPDQPTEEYRATGQRYAKPAILRRAMTESRGRGPGIRAALEVLRQRNIPVLLVWGRQDQVSLESLQIDPLRKIFPYLQESILDSSGHALLWTRAQKLAEVIHQFIQGVKS